MLFEMNTAWISNNIIKIILNNIIFFGFWINSRSKRRDDRKIIVLFINKQHNNFWTKF